MSLARHIQTTEPVLWLLGGIPPRTTEGRSSALVIHRLLPLPLQSVQKPFVILREFIHCCCFFHSLFSGMFWVLWDLHKMLGCHHEQFQHKATLEIDHRVEIRSAVKAQEQVIPVHQARKRTSCSQRPPWKTPRKGRDCADNEDEFKPAWSSIQKKLLKTRRERATFYWLAQALFPAIHRNRENKMRSIVKVK